MANYSNLSEEELRKLFNVTKTPAQANQFSQEAAAQVNPMLAPQNANVNMDFSGQPAPQAPQAPSIFQPQQTQLMPSQAIGQYPAQTNQFSQEAAAQVNPMLAPQNANASFDFSDQPTPQAPQAPQGPLRTPEDFQSRAAMFAKEPLTRAQQFTVEAPNMIGATLRQIGGNIKAPFVTVDDYLNNPNRPSIAESWSKSGAKIGIPEYQTTSAEAGPLSYNIVTDPVSGENTIVRQADNVASPAGTNESLVNNVASPTGTASSQVALELPVAQNLPSYTPYQEDAIRAQAEMGVDGLSPIPKFLSDQGIGANRAKRETAEMLQQGNGLTTVGGTPLSEFLSGKALPEQGLMRAENPMYGDNSLSRGLGGDAATQAFQDASAAREARIEQNFGNGQAVSDRERRGTGEMSMEAAVRMAGGDRDKARQMIELQRQGRDPITGAALKSGDDGLSFDDQIALRRQNLAEKSFDYNVAKDSKKLYDESLALAKEASTQEERDAAVGKGLSSSVKDMRDVMKRAAGRLDQFFSTGMAGKAASFWKGSDADAQESDFAFLKSNVALNAMMELKSNSPTGSTGFGALNTEELKTLQNQFATLDPFTSPELVRKNIKQLNDRFEGIIQSAYDKHKAKYGDEAANRVYGSMIGGNTSGQSSQPQANAVTYSDGSNYELI